MQLLPILALAAAAARPLAAEVIAAAGMVIDLPAGFALDEGDGRTRFSYRSPEGQIRQLQRRW